MFYGSPQRQQQQQQSSDLNQPCFRKDDQQQMSSGLLRYRSAPSSLFGEVNDYFLPVRPSSPETETMFNRIFSQDMEKAFGATTRAGALSSQFEEASTAEFTASPPLIVYQQQQQQMSRNCSVEGSYDRAVGSMGMDAEKVKNNSNNLIRQSSSPAGLFTHFNVENGFGMMRELGGLRNATSPAGDSANRMQRQLSFSSRQNSIMSQISEIGTESMDDDNPEDSSGAHRSFIPGFHIVSSDEASMLSENKFSGLRRGSDGKVKTVSNLNSLESQNDNARNHVSVLSPQFSLPMTSSEMAAIEKFLQLHDAVPCKIRAKRGYATHPRSIAERVRRTKISERMRKLQELVPNMDKQTNTADMLDLAVDYIKDLQKQAKTLSDARASCTCFASKQKSLSNPPV